MMSYKNMSSKMSFKSVNYTWNKMNKCGMKILIIYFMIFTTSMTIFSRMNGIMNDMKSSIIILHIKCRSSMSTWISKSKWVFIMIMKKYSKVIYKRIIKIRWKTKSKGYLKDVFEKCWIRNSGRKLTRIITISSMKLN